MYLYLNTFGEYFAQVWSKSIIPGRNKISDHTKAVVLSLCENDKFIHLELKTLQVLLEMFINKKFLCNLNGLNAAYCDKYSKLKIGFLEFCLLNPKWCVLMSSKGNYLILRMYSMLKCNLGRCSKK